MKTIGTVKIRGEVLDIVVTTYLNNQSIPCVELVDQQGFRYATFSTSMAGEPLEHGEFHVKTWSENTHLTVPMLSTGLFKDTGKRVPTGFCEAQVWRFVPGVLESAQ